MAPVGAVAGDQLLPNEMPRAARLAAGAAAGAAIGPRGAPFLMNYAPKLMGSGSVQQNVEKRIADALANYPELKRVMAQEMLHTPRPGEQTELARILMMLGRAAPAAAAGSANQ